MKEETLFEEALSLSPEERVAFLDQACGGRPELRAAVDVLLAAHEKSGNMLDKPLAAPGRTWNSTSVDSLGPAAGAHSSGPTNPLGSTTDYQPSAASGVVVAGRYTLVERIGEGGMGEVWVAKQTEPVKRKVALKLIKAGMDSKAVLQRFEQERQALAIMEHPNIARVIDGGMTAERRPFFVMELVNGLPLTRFCDEAKMGIRERLELFASICQAVQHAHQKGLIHRDLKPSNILVTIIDGKPIPKVIDFGVAKATSGRLTDESLSTQFGAVVGTLEYMSPEQAGLSGEDIDTRADIYSLGVILYELLTGLRPIDANRLKKAAFTEMIRIIKEEDPSKPSTRLSTDNSAPSAAALRHTEPKKLAALLRGELDWVVMKCLEKQRERRYETASGLARDLQRYLANDVVEARPPSAAYRARKFVSRHRGQVLAAGLLLLALLAGIAGTTWGLIREAKANSALAKTNAELARTNTELTRSRAAVQERYQLAIDAIETFHTGVSEDFLLKEEQFQELRDKLLRSAADFYGKLGALLGKETDIMSRMALATSNFELAGLTNKVGRKEDALTAHRAVLAAREAIAAEPGADAVAKVDVGRSLNAVAQLLEATGKTEEAMSAYRRSESLLTELAGAEPSARATLAACRSGLASLLSGKGKTAEAMAAYRAARADQEKLAIAPGASNRNRSDLAATIHGIGLLLSITGDPSGAEVEYRRALAIYQKLADDNPAVAESLSRLSATHHNLGRLLEETGKPSEAKAEIRKSLAIYQKLADQNPGVTQFRHGLAASHRELGELLAKTPELSAAEAEYRKSLAIYQKLAEDNPAVTSLRYDVSLGHNSLANLLATAGRSLDAETEYRAAIELARKLVDDNAVGIRFRQLLAGTHKGFGVFCLTTGKVAEAETEYREALAINQKLADEFPNIPSFRCDLADSYQNLGHLLATTGKPAEAEAEHRERLAIWRKLAHQYPKMAHYRREIVWALLTLGDLIRPLGRVAEARDDYDRAIAILQRLMKEDSTNAQDVHDLARSLKRRGLARRDLGDPAGAASDARRALEQFETMPSRTGAYVFTMGCCHAMLAGLSVPGQSASDQAEEAVTAMALLRKAVAMDIRYAQIFRTESSLDPLRGRADFQLLLMDLAMPKDPFVR